MIKSIHSLKKKALWEWSLHNPVELFAAIVVSLLTIVVFLQVLFRYALYAPLDWSEELAMVLFQWCCLIGAAIAVRRGTHYHLDILTSRLPESFKIPAGILASLCIFAMGYLMVHWGIQMMLLIAPQKYAILGFSIAYTYLAIPVSGTLIIFFQIPIFRKQIRSFSTR